MTKRITSTSGMILVLLAAVILVYGVMVSYADASHSHSNSMKFTARLSGDNEVPSGSGDPNGKGFIKIRANADMGKVCYRLRTKNIDTPTAGHIHVGAAGVNGGVHIGLFSDEDSRPSGCVDASKEAIEAMQNNPDQYYVNIHNEEYPPGAIRGQLEKKQSRTRRFYRRW